MPNKFEYNPSDVFQNGSSYPDPQNEQETREQLSRPLLQVRDFINNYLLTLSGTNVVSLRIKESQIEYSLDGEVWNKTGITYKDETRSFPLTSSVKYEGFVLVQGTDEIQIKNKFRLNGKMIESTLDGVTWTKTGQIIVDPNGNDLPLKDRLQFINADVSYDNGKIIVDAHGQQGAQGPQGEPGKGIPTGGTTGQLLRKKTEADYDTEWVDETKPLYIELNYPITSYTANESGSWAMKFYADINCNGAKPTMTAAINPDSTITTQEDYGLLTYTDILENNKVRCYFSEQPSGTYQIKSVELVEVA